MDKNPTLRNRIASAFSLFCLLALTQCTDGPEPYQVGDAPIIAREDFQVPNSDELTERIIKEENDGAKALENSRKPILYKKGVAGITFAMELGEAQHLLSKPPNGLSDSWTLYDSGMAVYWRQDEPRTPSAFLLTSNYLGALDGGSFGELKLKPAYDFQEHLKDDETGRSLIVKLYNELEKKTDFNCLDAGICDIKPSDQYYIFLWPDAMFFISKDREQKLLYQIRMFRTVNKGNLESPLDLIQGKFQSEAGAFGLGETWGAIKEKIGSDEFTSVSHNRLSKDFSGVYLGFTKSEFGRDYTEVTADETLQALYIYNGYGQPFTLNGSDLEIANDGETMSVRKVLEADSSQPIAFGEARQGLLTAELLKVGDEAFVDLKNISGVKIARLEVEENNLLLEGTVVGKIVDEKITALCEELPSKPCRLVTAENTVQSLEMVRRSKQGGKVLGSFIAQQAFTMQASIPATHQTQFLDSLTDVVLKEIRSEADFDENNSFISMGGFHKDTKKYKELYASVFAFNPETGNSKQVGFKIDTNTGTLDAVDFTRIVKPEDKLISTARIAGLKANEDGIFDEHAGFKLGQKLTITEYDRARDEATLTLGDLKTRVEYAPKATLEIQRDDGQMGTFEVALARVGTDYRASLGLVPTGNPDEFAITSISAGLRHDVTNICGSASDLPLYDEKSVSLNYLDFRKRLDLVLANAKTKAEDNGVVFKCPVNVLEDKRENGEISSLHLPASRIIFNFNDRETGSVTVYTNPKEVQ